ncbi:MAG TPA: hypothetical protein VFB65_12995, partial [Pyrinomonadaceae bacterium]|nr:hypothetical protein [Pyrinomonadaceae bacterium]
TFDGAVVEAVGSVAAAKAIGDELAALFKFLREETQRDGHNNETLAFLRSLSRRAGLGSIDEEVLKSLKDRAYSQRDWTSYHNHLRALVDLYDSSGAYKQIVDLLQAERARDAQPGGFAYASLIAANARLIGDSSLELQALRELYQKPAEQNQLATTADPLVERYFEALWESGEAGRSELLSCAQRPTSHPLQLITFLLTKNDRELVHAAIDNSPLSSAWKASRNAEVSLQLAEFGPSSENFFTTALRFEPIGKLITQKPDTTSQLVGDDWYKLAQTYGRWLYSSKDAEQRLRSRVLLPARMENRPQDVDEQARLGRWYLERKDLAPAIEHLSLARESQPDNKKFIADLGSAYFLRGDRQRANELWEKLIADEAAIDDYRLYLETLISHRLNEQARKRLTAFVVTRLKEDFVEENDNGYSQPQKELEDFKSLLRLLAGSFPSTAEGAKARFFAQLCAAAPENTLLPALLIRESLLPKNELGPFYEVLIERNSDLSSYGSDYSYTALRDVSFNDSDAESNLDQETGYKTEEPQASRITWQREYLDYLIEQRRTADARRLIASIERDVQRRFARPAWLRLASIRLDVRSGQVARAIDRLQSFVGIKTPVDMDNPKSPSIERLNDAVALLNDEGREAEAQKLLEAAYARGIALGQFETTYFTGLARVAFERGDSKLALTWLQTMIDLTAPESKEQTTASLMTMDAIAAHAMGNPASEDVQFDRNTALQLAAETAGEFAAYDAAINFRQQLLAASPADEENRIELVRLLAASGKNDEAIQHLAATIADRNASRTLRWQAIWLAPEIAGNDASLWTYVRDRVRSLNASDGEMNTALEALSLNASGRAGEALKLIKAADASMPNEYLGSLRAVVEKNASAADALNSLTSALIAARESTVAKSFGFVEDEPLEQIIALYLKQNQARAALKVAERVSAFRTNQNSEEQAATETRGPLKTVARYQTLRQRAEQRKRATSANLLSLLSAAAEQIGDLNRAVELARLRLAFVDTLAERNATQARLDHLQELQSAAGRATKVSLVVDQRLVASE